MDHDIIIAIIDNTGTRINLILASDAEIFTIKQETNKIMQRKHEFRMIPEESLTA